MKTKVRAIPSTTDPMLFENLENWLRPEEVSEQLGISTKTIYQWKWRKARDKSIPSDLFIKFNGHLYLRSEVLRNWILSQNC